MDDSLRRKLNDIGSGFQSPYKGYWIDVGGDLSVVRKRNLITKAISVAEILGFGGSTVSLDSDLANAAHAYDGDNFLIYAETFGFGDQDMGMDYKGRRVLEAKEKTGASNEVIVDESHVISNGRGMHRKEFEVLVYRPGKWEEKLATLYRRAIRENRKRLIPQVSHS